MGDRAAQAATSITRTILTGGVASPGGFVDSLHLAVVITGLAALGTAAAPFAFIDNRPAYP